MTRAEEIEYRLMPIIYRMEQRGVNLDGAGLKKDYDDYFTRLDELDDSIQQRLGRSFDIDSNAKLADAIKWRYPNVVFRKTEKTGKDSTSKEALSEAIKQTDPEILGMLLVRGAVATCLRTFIGPWNTQFQRHGRLYVKWNQFRNYTDTGARTGRLSSSPNLQNIPVEWEGLLAQLESINYKLPFKLPQVRKYIVPDDGYRFVGADYSAQEMRLLAHFAGGALLESIKANRRKDIHMIAAEIAGITRKVAKTLGFAVLYGAGASRVAESLHISVDEATRIKTRYLAALPEIKRFTKECTDLGKANGYIETLAGRRYKKDPTPKVINGRIIDYSYKLVNYKIQGSAGDQTKLAMINYDDLGRGELLLSVHDQLVAQEKISNDFEAGVTPDPLQAAMERSFQDVLRYSVIADPEVGNNFADMQSEREFIATHIGRS